MQTLICLFQEKYYHIQDVSQAESEGTQAAAAAIYIYK